MVYIAAHHHAKSFQCGNGYGVAFSKVVSPSLPGTLVHTTVSLKTPQHQASQSIILCTFSCIILQKTTLSKKFLVLQAQ